MLSVAYRHPEQLALPLAAVRKPSRAGYPPKPARPAVAICTVDGERVTEHAARIYGAIRRAADANERIPGHRELMQVAGLSNERLVSRALRELVHSGLLRLRSHKGVTRATVVRTGAMTAAWQCSDCGRPIAPDSRGRCATCARRGLHRAVPDDFVETLERLGSAGCAAYYRASLTTVTKWRRAKGLKPQFRAKRVSQGMRVRGRPGGGERPLAVKRDWSRAGQAAEFLRRFGPISRCDENRAFNPAGEFWNRNGHLLSADDVVSRAERLGWKPITA